MLHWNKDGRHMTLSPERQPRQELGSLPGALVQSRSLGLDDIIPGFSEYRNVVVARLSQVPLDYCTS